MTGKKKKNDILIDDLVGVQVEFDDVDEEGFLITRQTEFPTMIEAMEFIRGLNHRAYINC